MLLQIVYLNLINFFKTPYEEIFNNKRNLQSQSLWLHIKEFFYKSLNQANQKKIITG